MENKSLYIIIPAYNEEENIRQVIDDWYPIIEKYNNGNSRLVIIDDGSKDNTFQILSECTGSRPLLVPITKKNSGHGATVLYGYQYALEHGADFIFQTDSDGQTLPSEFESFWKEKDNYAMIIGNRTNREDGLSRIMVTKSLRFIIRLMFGVSVPDANTPFRLMEAERLRENIKYVPADFNLSNVILSVVYTKFEKDSIKYFPITFRPRQGGINSINIKKIITIGIQALKDFYVINSSLKQRSKQSQETGK